MRAGQQDTQLSSERISGIGALEPDLSLNGPLFLPPPVLGFVGVSSAMPHSMGPLLFRYDLTSCINGNWACRGIV